MKVNIRKISEITGFSMSTVSNALNRKRGVNKQTAEKILKTAEELGYRVEEELTKIRFVIFRKNGMIIDESSFHPAVIEGVEHQAKLMGYETIFCYVDVNDPDYEKQLVDILEDKQSAVVLLGTEMMEEDYEPYACSKNRIILLDGRSDRYAIDSVLINDTEAAEEAVGYLAGKGHERIGYLRGEFRIQAFRSRELGYYQKMHRLGLPVKPEYIAVVGTRIETAYQKMKEYLARAEELPTAFFADNDVIAIGCMRAMKECGYDVPGDISVIGFDDVAYGMVSDPPLSTMHVYKQELGARAVCELLSMTEKDNRAKVKIQVCAEFVERGSVKEIGSKR
ncbi:hypothetical protein C817_01275 [Dorea sp. 5-2]|nr:hypothetical protein C817_01275 [Dorea sp. 5-2]